MSEVNMRLTPEIITGLEYKKFKSSMYSLALGSPTKYYALREKILQEIETQLVKDIYATFYNALTEGKTLAGGPIRVSSADLEAAGLPRGTPDLQLKPVHYMTHQINNLALDCVADLENHLQKIVDIICPQDFEKVSSSRMALSGRASSLQTPTTGGAPP